MMKKLIAVLLIASLFNLQILIPSPMSSKAYAISWSLFGETSECNKDLSFTKIYPIPFWQTTTGAVIKYSVIAAGVAVTTYFTVGIGAMTLLATLTELATPGIGGMVWALLTFSWFDAFTAWVGYAIGTAAVEAVLSGSFAVIAGISVLCAIGDLAIAGAIHLALDYAADQIPNGTHSNELDIVKPKLFHDNISPAVKDDLKILQKVLDDFASEKGELSYKKAQAKHVVALLEMIDAKLYNECVYNSDEAKNYMAYNYLLSAIINYNLEKFDTARERLSQAERLAAPAKMGACYYIDALLSFQKGDERKGIELLHKIITQEPQAATPYILLAQILMKNERYGEAFYILQAGMNHSKEETCVMNWMAGNCLYDMERYEAAIPYYKTALRNMTINEYEAIYKLCIAKSYKKMGNDEEGLQWLDDAISEVKNKPEVVEELRRQYGE